MNVPDTSVIVPALMAWHPHHDVARRPLHSGLTVVGHCLAETFAVLTRLPAPHGMPADIVSEALGRLFARALVLDASEFLAVPRTLANAGVHGGATYDGVIALTAHRHGAIVLTLDARAARTYRALDVAFELLEA